jgi:peptide chain release factor 1
MRSQEADAIIQRAVRSGIISVRTYNSGGKGGQHSNRTMNAVEMTHLASGIRVNASTSKSQVVNRRTALRVLLSRILAAAAPPPRERGGPAGFCGKYVRTYHELDNRVVDHASGQRWSWAEVVGKNRLAPAIDARRSALEIG